MTENRFNYRIRKETTQYEIYDNWKTGEYPFIEPFFYKHSAKKICEFLNNLNDENEQLKSALKELKEIGDYQTNHIKELQEEIRPIQDICKKYKIPLEDLPDVLEEYITLDNEEYEEKLKERTIWDTPH